MSVLVGEEVRKRSRATGIRLAVLHELAAFVNDKRARAGEPWLAWPSQGLIAYNLNSSRPAVKRAVRELKAAGEITARGHARRGVKVWEITLPTPKGPYDSLAEYADGEEVPTPKSAQVPTPESGDVPGSLPTQVADPPGSESTHPPGSLSAHVPGSESTHKQEGEQEEEQENNNSSASADEGAVVAELFGFWSTTLQKRNPKLSEKRKRKVRARLREGFTAEDLRNAIVGLTLSDHHMGRNGSSTKYDDLELICRDPEHVEKFRDLYVERRGKGDAFKAFLHKPVETAGERQNRRRKETQAAQRGGSADRSAYERVEPAE